jgi:hypothetical protein
VHEVFVLGAAARAAIPPDPTIHAVMATASSDRNASRTIPLIAFSFPTLPGRPR